MTVPRIASLLVAALAAAAAVGQPPSRLTFDIVFDPDVGGRSPSQLAWSADGTRLGYVWDDGDGKALWALDPATGRREQLVKAGTAAGEGGPEISLDEYHWSPRGDALLVLSQGDLYLLSLGDKTLRRLTETDGAEADPQFSPDGRRVAYVRGPDLYLLDLESGRERALTEDGETEVILNGQTDWVYWEEIWHRDATGFWWSPDGGKIAFYRFDDRAVQMYALVDFLPRYPEVEWQRYPKAGEVNPTVRIGVVDLAGGGTTWLDTGDDREAYLARVHWTPRGEVAVQRLSREQDRLDLLACGAADGRCRVLLTETWPTWINLGDELTFLADGRFIWSSERSGWRQLYLYDGEGRLVRPLTSGEGHVTSLDGVDEAGGWLVYTRFGTGFLGAARRQVVRLELAGGEPAPLTADGGWHSALVAPRTGYWVHTWSSLQDPGGQAVRDRAGREVADLPAKGITLYDPAQLPRWETFTLRTADGVELPASLLKPQPLEPGRRYPVIMYHYGCPASQVVVDRWDGRGRDPWHKLMAQRGYAVLAVDNELSLFFGKRGEDKAHRRFGPLEHAAQLAAVEYLKGLPFVDPERIGLWGWSGGGANTLYSMLISPGTWRAGVAGAPVTDWRLYDTIWTERYLDHPATNAEGYDQSSPVTYAHQLKDRLLIVHGTGDDNVHPQNTLVIIDRFIAAGLPFEDAIYPRQKHGFTGPSTRHFFERMTEFFDRHLGGGQ